ncbi:pyridoxal-phosphate dependent enzyme [Kitasatospora sp. GP82]|uniref:pyridoxal-phosphate dependent enzyme n=1 Tax=Kitasatospora sp. GP82 TaxID=3035089 RepID=UPI0024761589|nr:pyridoxal-phosphate dependent enzyme [Kitasatospora sp. GP82]MDH6129700.1 cysteine synthase A [Kitasatospora sp. GP82]
MTATAQVPLADAARALAERAPGRAESTAPFGAVEAEAHRLLPALAGLRPTLGATPLVPVPSAGGRGRVWLKLESGNATGTVKARTAYALLCAALARAGSARVRLVEYSGGSLAVALAEFCALLGLDLHLVVPYGAPERLVRALRNQGAEVSSGREGTGFLGALDEAVRVSESQGRQLLLQHCAAEAAAMHREHTGAELAGQLAQQGVAPAALAASVGTGGTVLGVSLALRERWPDLRTLAVFPAEAPYGDTAAPNAERRMNGTGGLGHGLRQPLLAPFQERFEFRTVGYPDALDAMRQLRAAHGIAVSSSGGGAWLAASQVVDNTDGGGSTDALAVVAGRGTIEEWSHAAGD